MYKIRKYPDPILTKVAEPVTEFDSKLANIVEEMFLTMYEYRGVGLAAPQVGISKRLYVLNCDEDQPVEGEIALINPVIVSTDGEQNGDEGCLSFPGIYAAKPRPMNTTIKAQNIKGEWFEVSGEGLKARAMLHELDHLDGKIFVQNLELTEFIRVRKPLEKMKRAWKKEHVR